MAATAKKGLGLLVVALAAFYLFTQPEGAATALQSAGGSVLEAFEQIVRFLTALLS